jgi:hypothetical protein
VNVTDHGAGEGALVNGRPWVERPVVVTLDGLQADYPDWVFWQSFRKDGAEADRCYAGRTLSPAHRRVGCQATLDAETPEALKAELDAEEARDRMRAGSPLPERST